MTPTIGAELTAIVRRAEAQLLARIGQHTGSWTGFAPYAIEQQPGGDVICGVLPIGTLAAIAPGLGREREHEIAPVLEELREAPRTDGSHRVFVLSTTGAGVAVVRTTSANAKGGTA